MNTVKRRIAAALIAPICLMTGCASPYKDAIQSTLQMCRDGNDAACLQVPQLQAQERVWEQEQARRAAAIAAIAIAAGAAGYAASRR